MEPIILTAIARNGEVIQAHFLPGAGMNMISFKKGNVEVIDPSTQPLFDERFSGLGPLIGPHFHRRRADILPKIENEALFPHIARIRAKGIKDPFSHGIARYAPWSVESTETSFKAVLTGKDTWNGVPLSVLEGQNFKFTFDGELNENGLFLELSIVSDTSSLVGIHYYYRLPNGQGRVVAQVQNHIRKESRLEPIPKEWNYNTEQKLFLPLDEEMDFTFRPFPDPLKGDILLETEEYSLRTRYSCKCEENSWQLYHPKGASFVCIEPISSQDPRNANLTVSSLKIHLEITE